MITLRHRPLSFAAALLVACALAVAALVGTRTPSRGDSPDGAAKSSFEDGVTARSRGLQLLAEATSDPEDAKRTAARKSFDEAAAAFKKAEQAFAARAGSIDPQVKELPADFECAACCRCALAEMQLRQGQAKEASATLAPFVKEPVYRRSHYQHRALYYHGLASFQLGDLVAAGRSLNQLAPFSGSLADLQGRYVLAHVHRLLGELPEAALHYEGVAAGYEALRKDAAESLHHPGRFNNDPEEKARLQAIVDQPAPSFVSGSIYCRGVLLYELQRMADSQAAFADFLSKDAGSPLRADAQLCLGMTQVTMGQYAEAIETLRPLATKDAARAPQALLWLGRALLATVKPDDSDEFKEALAQAVKSFQRSAELLADEAKRDSAKRAERGEALLELASAQQLGGQHRDAARTLQQIADESLLPARAEELLQKRVSALNLAGQHQESSELCREFHRKFPRSILLPEILFRQAENARMLALAATQDAERKTLHGEAEKHYQKLVDSYPEYDLVHWAQHELAMALYKKGDFERCKAVLERIPGTDRRGPLAAASYLLADCQMRTAPARADDALAAGQLQEQLHAAIDLLTSYVEEQPEPSQVPEALLRLGLCKQRLSALQAQAEEHDRLRDAARGDFERLLIDYPLHPLQPQAALERSRCRGGDDPKSLSQLLRRFTQEPLSKSPVAPLAVLRLGSLLRSQENGAREAVTLLARCRHEHEKLLLADPERKSWVAVLQYQHAIALMETSKPAPAGAILDDLLKQFPKDALAAEVGLRREQCRIAEGWQTIERADQGLGAGDLKPEEVAALQKQRDAGWEMIRTAVGKCEKQADALGEKQPDIHAALLYQGAWTQRSLAEPEVNAARDKLRQELHKKLQDEAARKTPKGQPVPEVPVPEVPLSQVPLQAAEKKVRALYDRLVREQPEHPLGLQSALEFAELYVEREEHAAAIALIKKTLEREPSPELTDRLRLRLAMCLLAQKDEKTALHQLETVASRADSPFAPLAHLRAGEILLAQERWKEALKHLALFRDQEAFQGQGGLTDRALLLLGHVLAHQEKWDDCRTALTLLVGNYSDSPWCNEARYRLAWTYLKQKLPREAQHALDDFKVDQPTELAQKGRLLLGICYLERKKHAEAIAALSELAGQATIPDIAAIALLEWSHACRLTKKRDDAEKLLKQVVEKYPETTWAAFAKDRLKTDKVEVPAPHTLAAVQQLLTPQLLPPAPLEPLGQMQPLNAGTDDPSAELSLAYALNGKPSERTTSAPLVRIGLNDPFEHRAAMKGKIPREDVLPLAEKVALPGEPKDSSKDSSSKDSSKDAVARMVHYSGQVQGVGFRATAVEISRDYPVTGWVKNLDDGRVELLVEGPEADVKKFLDAVRARWKKNIEKEQVEEKKPTGEFKKFEVRQ